MASCALCHEAFPSKLKLVQHFSEAHSIARQRSRRTKGATTTATDFIIRQVAAEADAEEVVIMEEEDGEANYITTTATTTRQQLLCQDCNGQFDTRASLNNHQCGVNNLVNSRKQPVACQYCGQMCKDRRGAAIHQNFCERRQKDIPVPNLSHQDVPSKSMALLDSNTLGLSSLYECPGDDCGAIFKSNLKLKRHLARHHAGENIGLTKDNVFPVTKAEVPKVRIHSPEPPPPPMPPPPPPPPTPPPPAKPPIVTVTMKPHVGKTEGLQDLSLLITPAKPTDEFPAAHSDNKSASSPPTVDYKKELATSITLEECHTFDDGLGGLHEAVIYIADDGTVIKNTHAASQNDSHISSSLEERERTILLITRDEEEELNNEFKCSVCQKCFVSQHLLMIHMEKHTGGNCVSHVEIKLEPEEYDENVPQNDDNDNDDDDDDDEDDDDEDWEMVTVGKRKNSTVYQIRRNNVEYRCSFCKRNFLSELGYQTHIKNKECRNKKFKLPRMFSCHFKQCDSSYFKLTELQRHWQLAHKFTMASKTLQFDDESTFTEWLAREEEKYKVRFTCDVKRRKPHRTERLLVCHRFHHLRTAAARKNAHRQYSDKHNWVHKIQPCLCFARMKVYQDFNEDTCDYTGKISVIYYHEHSHSKTEQQEVPPEILDHILQRNKRNRNNQFQDLKGSEKHLHRQKLERFARLAGKEYRPSFKASDTTKKVKRELSNPPIISEDDEDQIAAVNVANNLLGTDELFATQVEMVLDGQFDMGHEVLSTHVVTHLDSLPIFATSRPERSLSKEVEEDTNHCERNQSEEEEGDTTTTATTMQALLPASSEDWQKLFEVVRARVASEGNSALKAEAEVLLPYQKVIDLVSPTEQIPIFRQLWELAYPSQESQEGLELEMRMAK